MLVPALIQKHEQSLRIVIFKAVCRFVVLLLSTFSGFSIFSAGFSFAFDNFARYFVLLLNVPLSDEVKKRKVSAMGYFPEKSRSVVDPRRSRCPIGLRFQEASNLLAWHELFANLYELTSRILVLGGIKPLWANMKGIWIWPIFVKFRQNIPGIMTNESVSKNFDIWNTQHDSHIFSYINFRCRYLDNQSKYRRKPDTLFLIDALWMRLCSQFARAAASDTR